MSQGTLPPEQNRSTSFDLAQALDNMDGDRELFQELVTVFLEESAQRITELREGIRNADAGLAEKAAHTIKGTVGNFAAPQAFERAFQLEVLAREKRLSELPQAFAELEQELDLLRDALLEAAAQVLGSRSGKSA